MTRIVFINLHSYGMYLTPSTALLFKRSIVSKHRYILNHLLLRNDVEVVNYITKDGFTLTRNLPKPIQTIMNSLRYLECGYVMRKNNISSKSVKIITAPKDINDGDIVIMGAGGCIPQELSSKQLFIISDISHFGGNRKESEAMRKLNPDLIFAESDMMKHSPVFKAYYSWFNNKFIVMPFVAASRFQKKTPFSERKDIAFSTGTIAYRNEPDYVEATGMACMQPIRETIFQNKKTLAGYIDCYNAPYYENDKQIKIKSSEPKFIQYIKLFYNLTHSGKQKNYFSFNMVDKFNEYKMCIIAEELMGIPGIGFAEGMACGCAYIGQTIGYYEDYGMKEGIHYIGYDGTLDDLKVKITYYQQPEHQEELERIANAGYEFAQTHFRGDVVAKELFDKLIKAQEEWKESR